MRDSPLAGCRVLDLTAVLAGPFCTYQLGLLGADVIKVERPTTGDLARSLGSDVGLNERGVGSSFLAENAGKRSITLSLKTPAGQNVFRRLIDDADVLVESFRPGVMKRFGFDWPTLHEINPRLVYCAISGFGQDGPMSDRPAYDQIIQGLSGMMSVTGPSGGDPLRAGFPVCDTFGGMTAAFAIVSALHGRDRTGLGSFVDVSLLDSAIAAMAWVNSNYLIGGVEPQRMGNDNFTAAPSGTFTTKDGLVNIAANEEKQFAKLCELLARPDLVSDPRFSTRDARKRNRAALTAELETALSSRSAVEWEQQLAAHGVPIGQVLDLVQALNLEQVTERSLIANLGWLEAAERDLKVVTTGFLLDGARPIPRSLPPALGADTEDELRAAGFTDEDVAVLREQGAV